ncbi:7066_t:CDS:10 [Funneliformis mosseae]|uniref:7066_t:CDS:1 n=1 Tax=Funneliformis mosseae TaxID=27381 RepID=A0A9N9EZB6_FUNMO|nr:7066_t:CDS:10 [Funneliformis mosseae]
MFQKPIIIVCSGGPSGLIFALSLSEILVKKQILGQILIYHEVYKNRNSKNQLFLVNEAEFSRLPQSVRDYLSHAAVFKEFFSGKQTAYFMEDFEDKLMELIAKLDENVQLVPERFDPECTSRYDLLVLADGNNYCDNYQFEKKAVSKHYELEIKFHVENHSQNNEMEALSLIQTRYLLQFHQDGRNFLKVNLSKSEYDSIESNPSLDSVKNNPWLMNIIRDGFKFFKVDYDNLISISKNSNDLLVTKEFYKNHQKRGQNESFVCVIGNAAFNCKSWQNRSKLNIAISTAVTLAEKLIIEQALFEFTRKNFDRFSNAMLNIQQDFVQQLQLTNMEDVLFRVIQGIINKYNNKCSSEQVKILPSVDSFNFITILDEYPQFFEIDQTSDNNVVKVLNELKEEYTKNVQNSTPELFLKTLDGIQNTMNYFIMFESYLSSHILDSKNNELNKDDRVKLNSTSSLQGFDNNNTSGTSSDSSEDSSDEETQSESSDDLSLEEFFQMTFGDDAINYDATNFVTAELNEDVFKTEVVPYLKYHNTQGILRIIFPYIVDIINRTIPLQRIQDCIRQSSASDNIDDPSQILKRLANCNGRDYLVAFLDKVPKKALTKVLISLTRANIPIPLLFTNKSEFSQKGLKILREIRSLVLRDKYHLLLSFNLSTCESVTPFSKRLYPVICKNREDDLSITSAGSIDISFHPASENNGRKPVAIAEVYLEEDPNQIFLSIISGFSQFAFYMFLHINDQDFEGNSPSNELKKLIKTVSSESNDSKISIIYWSKSKNNDLYSKRKKTLKKLLDPYVKSECIKIEQIPKDINQFLEKKKEDVLEQLSNLKAKFIFPQLTLKLPNNDSLNIWNHEIGESSFSSKMKLINFKQRSDIFRATYFEHEIEALNDKKSTTESQENEKFMTEGEIQTRIQQARREQNKIGLDNALSIFTDFANLLNENNIENIRDFASQIDDYFKRYLNELQNNDNGDRTENKKKIEENDISIHDFWREFIILSDLYSSNKSRLEHLYHVKPQKLQEAYKTWILEGEPLQLLDGLSLRSLPTKFLSNVLSNLMTNLQRRLIVISVIGLESSGKSTLLNYLFHCGFATSASRCTKGVYMSYRTANIDGNTIDLLILDSEGMASTAQKYITHRTSFDKKITLLALMCSQIVIINTKGLTRDIGDILEVSSWHLDALRHRQSKPRLHFVLRDMVDTIEAQKPAFKDIVDGLRKMFDQIPGCLDSLEDFMSVEQDDVHLLENAFSCYKDDFRPRINNIGKTENVNLPAEVFPAKISSLRQSLLKSALLQKNNSLENFTNVQGKNVLYPGYETPINYFNVYRTRDTIEIKFDLCDTPHNIVPRSSRRFIPYMKTVWSKINTYGSFLHFESFKAIQAWCQMRNLVNIIHENRLPDFTSHSKNIIDEYVEKIKADYSKWNQIESEFRMELDSLADNWKRENLKYYSELVQEQFDASTVDEGKRLIHNMIAAARREQDAQWMSLVREYKDSWLSACAIEKVGKKIKGLNTALLKGDEVKCTKIFEEIWKEVEEDKKEFTRQMVIQPEKLKQHVQQTFNNAIGEFSSIRQDSEQKEKEKFKRSFWTNLKKPSTLDEHINIDVQQIQKIINVNATLFDTIKSVVKGKKSNIGKKKLAKEVKSKIIQTINGITHESKQKLSLHIEHGQAIEWLKILCDCLFDFTQSYNIEFQPEFDFFEKYLRLQIYTVLRNNTIEWEKQQKEKLDHLKNNLLSSFQKILTDFSNESLSKEILKFILLAFKQKMAVKGSTIDQKLQYYLRFGWMNTHTATNYAYQQSFDALNINAIQDYLEDPTEYMHDLFNNDYAIYSKSLVDSVVREIEEYINIEESLLKAISEWSALFHSDQNYNQLLLSHLIQYLFGNSIPSKEYQSFRAHMQYKCNISMKKSVPSHDFSDLLKDVKNLFGSITVEKPVDFCNALKKYLIEGLKDFQTECRHQVTNHLLPAFNGGRGRITKHPSLIVCTEDEAHDHRLWSYGSDHENSNGLALSEFLRKYHPSWLPFPRSEPSDEHVTKMRAIWWRLKDELCERYDMIDNTDPSWGSRYGSLILE